MSSILAKEHPLIAAELTRFPYAADFFEHIKVKVSETGEIENFYIDEPCKENKYLPVIEKMYGKQPSVIKSLAEVITTFTSKDKINTGYSIYYHCGYNIPTDISFWIAFAAASSYADIPDVSSYEVQYIIEEIGTMQNLKDYLLKKSLTLEDANVIYDILASRSTENKILAMLRTEKFIPSKFAIAMYVYAEYIDKRFWATFAKACYKL